MMEMMNFDGREERNLRRRQITISKEGGLNNWVDTECSKTEVNIVL